MSYITHNQTTTNLPNISEADPRLSKHPLLEHSITLILSHDNGNSDHCSVVHEHYVNDTFRNENFNEFE